MRIKESKTNCEVCEKCRLIFIAHWLYKESMVLYNLFLWLHIENQISLNVPSKLEDFLVKPDTRCIKMKRALTGFTEENLMELSRHLSRTTATLMGSQIPTADIPHSSSILHCRSTRTRKGKSQWFWWKWISLVESTHSPDSPLTFVSKVQLPLWDHGVSWEHLHWYIFLSELLSKAGPTSFPCANSALLCRVAPGVKAWGQHSEAHRNEAGSSVEDAPGLEADVTVLVACGTHAGHRQVKLPIWTRTDFVESLQAACGTLSPLSQLG